MATSSPITIPVTSPVASVIVITSPSSSGLSVSPCSTPSSTPPDSPSGIPWAPETRIDGGTPVSSLSSSDRIDVVFVTAAKWPNGSGDDQLFLTKLRHHAFTTTGVPLTFQIVVWDDATFDWSRARVIVIRSPWDYQERYDEFSRWLSRIESLSTSASGATNGSAVLANAPSIIRWNWHKKYLLQIRDEFGINIVPSLLLPIGSKATDVRQGLTDRGWAAGVLKPCISAGGAGCTLIRSIDSITSQHEKEWETLMATNDTLLQPYMSSIQTQGEISLVFLDQKYSHALRKIPPTGEFKVHGGLHEAYKPSSYEIDVATRALQCAMQCVYASAKVSGSDSTTANTSSSSTADSLSLHQRCLYTRVDMLCSEPIASTPLSASPSTVEVKESSVTSSSSSSSSYSDGRTLMVSELELLEPDLFFRLTTSAAVTRMNDAIIERVVDQRTRDTQ